MENFNQRLQAKINNDIPKDESAERAVLGSMLYNVSLIPFVMEKLNEDDFFDPLCRLLYSFLIHYYLEYKEINTVLIASELQARKIENITLEFLESLVLESVQDLDILEEIVKLIKDRSIRRKLLDKTLKTLRDIQNYDVDVNSLASDIVTSILDIVDDSMVQTFTRIDKVAEEEYKKLTNLAQSKTLISGVPSGFQAIDTLTTGFQDGNVIIVAARPGMGKSSFMLSMAKNMADIGISVGIFSLEMSKEQLIERLYSIMSGISLYNIRTGLLTIEDINIISKIKEKIKGFDIYIDDSGLLTVNELRVKAKRLVQEKGVKIIFIDYFQLLKGNYKYHSRQEEVADISRSLKVIAKELKVPIVALAQLSRQNEQRAEKRPQLSDLRESGQIEQDADIIMFLHRPEKYKKNPLPEEKGLTELIVAKHRQGATGIIKLLFLEETTGFFDNNKNIESLRYEDEQNESILLDNSINNNKHVNTDNFDVDF